MNTSTTVVKCYGFPSLPTYNNLVLLAEHPRSVACGCQSFSVGDVRFVILLENGVCIQSQRDYAFELMPFFVEGDVLKSSQ